MGRIRMVTLAMAVVGLAGAAFAQDAPSPHVGASAPACSAGRATDAADVPMTITGPNGQANGQFLIGATLMLEMAKLDSDKVRKAAEPCDLGVVSIAGQTWRLSGGGGVVAVRALAESAGAPVAAIYPVVDVLKAMEASQAHAPPPPTRFILITLHGPSVSLWRGYDAVPGQAQFEKDLTAAISGQISPVATVDTATKAVNIIVSHDAGAGK